jgi:hypothetical protein
MSHIYRQGEAVDVERFERPKMLVYRPENWPSHDVKVLLLVRFLQEPCDTISATKMRGVKLREHADKRGVLLRGSERAMEE